MPRVSSGGVINRLDGINPGADGGILETLESYNQRNPPESPALSRLGPVSAPQGRVQGPLDASIVLIEYGDFECPAIVAGLSQA